jgi:O-antigen/teichoic acid export membrane protein
LNLVVMLPVAIIGWFTLSPLVLRFLPEYAPGIQAAQISLVGALTFVYSGPSVLIPILRRNLPSQLVGVVCIGLVWAGGIYAVSAGHGIVGVAIARVAANAIYCVFNICFVFYLTHQDIRPE